MPQLCRGYSAGVLVGNYSEEVDQISGKLAALINSSGDLASDRYWLVGATLHTINALAVLPSHSQDGVR